MEAKKEKKRAGKVQSPERQSLIINFEINNKTFSFLTRLLLFFFFVPFLFLRALAGCSAAKFISSGE
jgi:hypothetical protein